MVNSILRRYPRPSSSIVTARNTTKHMEPTATASNDAIFAALNSKPTTDEARALVNSLARAIEDRQISSGLKRHRHHGKMWTQFEAMVSGFVADLFRATTSAKAQGWVFRSLDGNSFTGDLSRAGFKDVFRAMIDMGLVIHVMGQRASVRFPKKGKAAEADTTKTQADYDDDAESDEDNSGPEIIEAKASRFRATDSLIDLAREAGVSPEDVRIHFLQELPKNPVVLKSSSVRRGMRKIPGSVISLKSKKISEAVREQGRVLESEMRRLNTFLDGFTFSGGYHRGYRRVYNMGDREDFRWNLGGRLYSQGEDSYQRMKEIDRLNMTIDDQPVAEIDIKASYLTILHGTQHILFDPTQDPYLVDGLEPLKVNGKNMSRWVIKQWVVATLGHTNHHTRWPSRIAKDFKELTEGLGLKLKEVYPVSAIRAAMERRFPLLADWGSLNLRPPFVPKVSPLSWADLMYLESVAIVGTMFELMDEHRAPSLSIHDSILVRRSDVELAKVVLSRRYKAVCGVSPSLEIARSNQPEETWCMEGGLWL